MHTSAFHCKQSIGVRQSQQDSVGNLIVGEQHLYVLADGMGGHRGGETASQTAVSAFLNYFETQPQAAATPEQALLAALNHANAAIAAVLQRQPELDGMGTTLLAVLLDTRNGAFSFVSVGDSPLYHWDGSRLERINANHAFAEELKKIVAAGGMSEAEAQNHPARHAVTSALTGGEIHRTDLHSAQLHAGSVLLLASDGLQVLDDAPHGEIAHILQRRHRSAEALSSALIQAADGKQHPHQDNTSVWVLFAPDRAPKAGKRPQAPNTKVSAAQQPSAAPRRLSKRLLILIAAPLLLLAGGLTALMLASEPPPAAEAAASAPATPKATSAPPAPVQPISVLPASGSRAAPVAASVPQ